MTINDVFRLRFVNARFSAVINENIASIANQVARNTFPIARHLLHSPSDGIHPFEWPKNLIPMRLASIIVDRKTHRRRERNPHSYPTISLVPFFTGIPAEVPGADGLRATALNGLRMYKQLSDISKAVYALPHKQLPSTFVESIYVSQLLHLLSGLFIKKEVRIIERRECLIVKNSLPTISETAPVDCCDYLSMHYLLQSAFESQSIVE